jgi:type IV fimbrial biogenesis protein FimT
MAVALHHRSTQLRSPPRGFGLIELVIVIAIIAILTVIALPSYQRTIQLNRVVTDTNDLLAAMNLARNEAVARGRPVTICASVNHSTCDGTGNADWSGGYMVFTDYDPVGVIDAGSGDELLRVIGPAADHDTVKATTNIGYVSFSRTGTVRFPTNDNPAVFFISSVPCDPSRLRSVSITTLGRSASKTETTCP